MGDRIDSLQCPFARTYDPENMFSGSHGYKVLFRRSLVWLTAGGDEGYTYSGIIIIMTCS